jgi:hypothetical protein
VVCRRLNEESRPKTSDEDDKGRSRRDVIVEDRGKWLTGWEVRCKTRRWGLAMVENRFMLGKAHTAYSQSEIVDVKV